jgi:nucleotide-binding universal stress UspA family protein
MPASQTTIICAVDFSRHMEDIARLGTQMAQGFRAKVVMFHALRPGDETFNLVADDLDEPESYRVRQAKNKILDLMADADVDWEIRLDRGDPVDTLAVAAEQTDADLIITASYRLSGIQRILAGSVIERAARHIQRPILVLPAGHARKPGKDAADIRCIVAACQLKKQIDPVSVFAWDMARRFQADLHLVHAMESPLDEEIVDPTAGPYLKVQEELQKRIRWRLIESLSDTVRHWDTVHAVAEPGPPGEVIDDYARRHRADMIVVGVRPQSVWRKTLVGSTTEALIRHAPCAVLTVPPEYERNKNRSRARR